MAMVHQEDRSHVCAKQRGLWVWARPAGRWGGAGPIGWVLGTPLGSEPTSAALWGVTGPPGQGLALSLLSGSSGAHLVGSLKGCPSPIPPWPADMPGHTAQFPVGTPAAFGVEFLQENHVFKGRFIPKAITAFQ